MDNKNIEFVDFDNNTSRSSAGSTRIRFEIKINQAFKGIPRASIQRNTDGSFSAWLDNKVIHIGERSACVEALRERGINFE